ncbi:MAG: AAA family ATPase [Bacteroidota bacterium]|nr:AAA family ATPase [Bacteroidota bacterium]
MITKINKLKNFGIYQDFTWGALPEFKRFNLIYGWNRSGKSTLSRVFSSCEKEIRYDDEIFKNYPENGEFEISTNSGLTIKSSHIEGNNLQIKVFNQDFISDNISFEPSEYCNAIIYLSEEDIESKKQLEDLKAKFTTLKKEYELSKINKVEKEKIKNGFLTGVGREISNILFDKTYNKAKAEAKIIEIGIDKFEDKELSEEIKNKFEQICKSKPRNQIPLFKKIPVEPSNNLKDVYIKAKGLLEKEVVSETLERLKTDIDLNNWVKTGFEIHKSKDEFGTCLFCQNPITNQLFDSLSRHFSKDYTELQSTIEYTIKKNKELIISYSYIENSDLNPDLKPQFDLLINRINENIKKHNDWLLYDVESLLELKNVNPFDKDLQEMIKEPGDYVLNINNEIENLNEIILKHNEIVNNHSEEVKKARESLELHTISTALVKEDYKKMVKEFTDCGKVEKEASEKLNINLEKTGILEKQNSKIGEAIGKINKHLREFFGREEIVLDLDETKKGYVITRNGIAAKNLSEGEKTAIAFSYFIVKVEENDFKINNGIIFIDDPISSFDSNFIYHCFSLINTHFTDVGQLFISTHNFHFFNLTKEWFFNKNSNTNKANYKLSNEGKPIKPMPCEFYMINNYTEDNVRKASIGLLDKTLGKYKSEYQFLFSCLNKFIKSTPDFADLYSIGNIARRFFDIFADFKVPDSRDQKQKMELIISEINASKEHISAIECAKVYKLINEFSHNYNPVSAIEHTDKQECIEAVSIVLKTIELSDPKHYDILLKNCL